MEVEIRNNDSIEISGYVNAVERKSRTISRVGAMPFKEIVKSGVFTRALQQAEKVDLMLDHERVITDTQNGLELREDNIGLHATANITDPEIVGLAKQGKLTGWSFGFRCLEDNWGKDGESDTELRTLENIQLLEVSILTKIPAYIATSVEIRESGEIIEQRFDTEKNVRYRYPKDTEKDTSDTEKDTEQRALTQQALDLELELLKIGG